jgi:hypothetical protein
MPCPKSVSLAETADFNYSNLPAAQRTQYRTYLGIVARMELSPTADYRADCIQEHVTFLGGNCPASVMAQVAPCSGHACLPVGRTGGDAATGASLIADPSSFLDLHRTRHAPSVLDGSGVTACSYTCFQNYYCHSRPGIPIGAFTITRNLRADTYTPPGGAPISITTGSVEKRDQTPPKGDFPEPPADRRFA